MRKTIARETIVARANAAIAASASADERRAIATVLDGILMDGNAYAGFGYLTTELNDDGTLRADYDDTRRRYA